MDRDEPFSFETGDSGLTGNVTGNDTKPINAGSLPSGRIDPAIARATAGGEAGTIVSDNGGTPETSSGDAAENTTPIGTPEKRGRGRPRKTEAQGQTGSVGEGKNVRVSFIEKTLMGIHLGFVAVTKCPEFELAKDDAKLLAEATAGVLALYKVRMTPKQEAYGLLIEALGQVYVPMGVSIYMRKKMEAEARGKTLPPQAIKQPPKTDARAPTAPIPTVAQNMGNFDPTNISIPQ